MQKRILALFLAAIVLSCVGCGTNNSFPESKIATYTQFVQVFEQNIEDGTVNGLGIRKYVDLETGVIYLYTEKFQSGYGTTWSPQLDTDGKPIVYEGLEELRKEYNWN